jgi:N,N'-diacetyllegionaminate synthase
MTKTLIIAEAGVNHNGDIELAKKLIAAAADAGADYVKFQTFKAEKLASLAAKKAEYQNSNMKEDQSDSQLDMLKKLELSLEDHCELIKYCKQKNIRFLSTAFDLDSIDLLKELGITIGKIPSGEITNYPYLVKMAHTFESIIMSTGMSTISDIREAFEVLTLNGKSKNDITILHCNTEYPTPMQDVNLLAMNAIKNEFKIEVGYSDHTLGIEVPIAAVALGARIIEKHFTLDKTMQGPDHKASLEPSELKDMVQAIRNIEKALGHTEKIVSTSEQKNKFIARKSIVAMIPIKKGDVFTELNVTVKRPGDGINPMKWKEVIGKISKRDFMEDELIEE